MASIVLGFAGEGDEALGGGAVRAVDVFVEGARILRAFVRFLKEAAANTV